MENTQPTRKKILPYTLAIALVAVGSFAVISACTDKQADAKPNLVFKENKPQPNALAKIGDDVITEEELIGDDKLDFHDLKKREYELRMARLNELLVERLVGAQAKKANMPLDEYIDKKILGGDVKVSDSEYKAFVKEKKIPESQLNPQIKERIMSYLKSQKREETIQSHVAKLTKKDPVEVYFKKPKLQIPVEVGEAPLMGKKSAPVTIVEFSDFQCPFCARGAETITQIKKKYGNKVVVAFKHFPLPMHREAKPASAASMCVHEQNADKFWDYHDLLFQNQDKMSNEDLKGYAKKVGVNMEKFNQCFESNKYMPLVEQDMAYGERIGVRSTPTFFVNGQLISGAVPIETFSEVIDEELQEAKK